MSGWETIPAQHEDAQPEAEATVTEAANQAETSGPQKSKEEYASAAQALGWTEPVPIDYASITASALEGAEWAGVGARYEWNDDYGDIAPRVPELEAMLFGGEYRMRAGTSFEALAEFECDVQGPERLNPVHNFSDAGLHPVMLENLQLCGYSQPTPIQSYCIPYGLKNHDMVAIAQTGSGKTAAYMIPVISKLMGKAKKLSAPKPNTFASDYNPARHAVRAEPLVVIVVPARELALQIFDEARRMCYRSMLRPCVTYGGLPYRDSIEDLSKGCDVLIATPGRLADLMNKPQVLSMRRVKYTIIDEADELLEADWEEQLAQIMTGGDTNVDADHTFMLFSATFPNRAADLANEYLDSEYFKISIGRSGSTHRNIEQDLIFVAQELKQEALYNYICSLEPCRILIFCNSRQIVDRIDDFLYNRSLPVTSIHSQRSQREREDNLRAFRTGKTPICVATGVTARGLDISGIAQVIQYDLPSSTYGGLTEYIHRIGRTARIGHKGKAVAFYNERDEELASGLTNLLIESGNKVPDFLQQYVHEDGKAHFEDDNEEQAIENDGDGSGPAWGSGNNEGDQAAWGAATEQAEDMLTVGMQGVAV